MHCCPRACLKCRPDCHFSMALWLQQSKMFLETVINIMRAPAERNVPAIGSRSISLRWSEGGYLEVRVLYKHIVPTGRERESPCTRGGGPTIPLLHLEPGKKEARAPRPPHRRRWHLSSPRRVPR